MLLGTGGWNQYLQSNRWVCSMDYSQLWKESYISKLSSWSYSTAHWKGCFLCNFKLADGFTNRPVSAKLRGLNEQSIAIGGLLSGVSVLGRHSILSAAQEVLFGKMPDRHLCVRKPSKDLLKMARTECAQIITLSFNCNRKFSVDKNTCLNALKAAEIDEHQLNSLTSIMRIPIPSSAFVFKGDKPDCLLCWFVFTHNRVYSIRLSKKVNHHTITALNFYQSV